ncbi:MAG: AAA family ATPase [Bacteroidales bacterium]|nr:AAA family ATPase [Bacteroidales bacterium]
MDKITCIIVDDEKEARDHRKPLVLSGARQVGKTTIVNLFAKEFDQYIHLNLELASENQMFDKNYSIDELLNCLTLLIL